MTIIMMVCGNGVLTAYGEENKEADGVQEDILIQAPGRDPDRGRYRNGAV